MQSTKLLFPFFRPDGQKKAYVRLAPDYDALDVANKVSDKSVKYLTTCPGECIFKVCIN